MQNIVQIQIAMSKNTHNHILTLYILFVVLIIFVVLKFKKYFAKNINFDVTKRFFYKKLVTKSVGIIIYFTTVFCTGQVFLRAPVANSGEK